MTARRMKLIGNENSACTRSVLMVLKEKNTPVEFVSIDLGTGAHKSDEHLSLNPFGKVPVLIHGDLTLYESQAINRYLEAILPGISLIPQGRQDIARMDQWLSVDSSYFTPQAYTLVWQKLFLPMYGGQTDQAVVKEAEEKLNAIYAAMDRAIGEEGRFLVGDSLSLADLAFVQYTDYILKAQSESIVFNYENVRRWWYGLTQRESYKDPLSVIL
ncbi:glutathione S-transferase [Pseudomonas protegens]|uniref:glutathione S-transferase family protein n=1 Tax=Pseudomonas TaxID=286 RepID=UPI0008908B91|nr:MULTISPECIES: glutathione S-transferase N-terminal domain-containing protein [Pseudomonas]GED78633.1 glutathione S-transferase [Pseudomonas fluorescens]AQT08657.1 glutathione S-transferase domain-containing protein [Pseudomonas protegens]MCS4260412.1 glutathione S-transferase [Pseudomonas sp. BIGb0176]MDF4210905.1 glutathione S-transferase N-terminal domain-containing protein [Pseudomonas protegens]MDK1398496.1 glutathione S-transferase N-terminal domain-containing protein [Pseudomonas prot